MPYATLSFSRLPAPNLPLALMMRASVDTVSADTGAESFAASDASSGTLAMRGGGAPVALAGPPGDLTIAGSRHVVSRALRGRASLDAMLMLGALVRAADEAGLAVTAIGGTPRLERIESGDLPPSEEGHPDRQTPSRQTGAAATAVDAVPRQEWCAGSQSAEPRLAPRPPQRRGTWCAQNAVHVTSSRGGGGVIISSSSGTAALATAALALGRSSNSEVEASLSCALGPGGGSGRGAAAAAAVSLAIAPGAAAAAAAAALRRPGDPDFTFSPPTVTGSLCQSLDTSPGQHSDLIMGHYAQLGGQQLADSNQVLELLMRLVTNRSTVGDNDLPSTSSGADRSSGGTGGLCTGTSTTGTGYGSRGVTGTGVAPMGAAAGAGVVTVAHVHAQTHRRSLVQRNVSEWNRHHNARRGPGVDSGGAAAGAAATPHAGAAAAAAVLAAQEGDGGGGSSTPLLDLQNRNMVLAGGSAGGVVGRHHSRSRAAAARRNSWDTLASSSSSAVAVAAAAAAALAAAGLLRASTSSRTAAGGGGGGYCSNSGRTATGSASRFWPMGGLLGEDSGPASLLLVGALSGGRSVGGTTSAASLVQLPTGSGSVRDVLSRIHQQQLTQQEGPVPAISSGSWSANTGLASLFDAHLTAALRRTGAVRTFKRAVGGPANFSHASSGISQQTGNLGRQDTSICLTSSLMMLNFGSTAGSSVAAGAAGSGGGGGGGVSQLGAATAATAAAAAAGLLAHGLTPPHVRRDTISSISTIHSATDAGSAAAAGGGRRPATDAEGEVGSPQAGTGAAAEAALTESVASAGGGGGAAAAASAAAAAAAAAAARSARNPSLSLAPGCEEHDSLSLALGLAAEVHGGAGSIVVQAPSGAFAIGAAGGPPSPVAASAAAVAGAGGSFPGSAAPSPSPPPEPVAPGSMGAGALAAGPVGAGWLQPQAPGGGGAAAAASPRRGTPGAELSASLDFSRHSWDTDWGGSPGGGATRGPDTFTFAGPSSFTNGRAELTATRAVGAGPDNAGGGPG
ncbi:hypothetical protein PLESTF_000793000 [Pleodorina starrii]|nr:hypothetical protein PLESTF_000793000 [Pleodorina starrii]